jgi:hypothetical protein
MTAWDCHKSQHNPKGFSSVMPDGMRREMAEREAYVLAAARVPLPEGVNDDLLAGLEERPVETPTSNDDQVALLRKELATGRALLALVEHYRKTAIEPAHKQVFVAFEDEQQEIVSILARAVRQAGEGAAKVEPGPPSRAFRLEIPTAQMTYLRGEVTRAVERYRTLASTDPSRRSMWEELAALSAGQRAALG